MEMIWEVRGKLVEDSLSVFIILLLKQWYVYGY